MNENIKPYLKHGTVVYFQGPPKILLWVQSLFTKVAFGTNSLWTHVGLVLGDHFFESSIGSDEVIRTPIKDRFSKKGLKKYTRLGFQFNFKQLSKKDWDIIQDYAENMVMDSRDYGTLELIGTLIRIVKWRFANADKRKELENQPNRFDSSNVYCIAFVADCMEANKKGLEYIDIHHSVSVVDEGWQDCKMACENKILMI